MDFLDSAALLGLALIVVVPLAAALVSEWRPAAGRPIPLYRMLRRQGDQAAHLALAAAGRDFRLAVGQCAGCGSHEQCSAWLDSGCRDGFEEFCLNAGYVARMRALASARSQ